MCVFILLVYRQQVWLFPLAALSMDLYNVRLGSISNFEISDQRYAGTLMTLAAANSSSWLLQSDPHTSQCISASHNSDNRVLETGHSLFTIYYCSHLFLLFYALKPNTKHTFNSMSLEQHKCHPSVIQESHILQHCSEVGQRPRNASQPDGISISFSSNTKKHSGHLTPNSNIILMKNEVFIFCCSECNAKEKMSENLLTRMIQLFVYPTNCWMKHSHSQY